MYINILKLKQYSLDFKWAKNEPNQFSLLNAGISTIVSFTEKVSENWTRKLIKGNSYDLYIKLSWGTAEQEQRLCYLNRKIEKQKRKSNFFKLSFVKTLHHPSTQKKRKKENQLGMKNPLKAGNAPSTFPSNHLLSPASSPFSISFWLLTVMHLHFLKKKKERKLFERKRKQIVTK